MSTTRTDILGRTTPPTDRRRPVAVIEVDYDDDDDMIFPFDTPTSLPRTDAPGPSNPFMSLATDAPGPSNPFMSIESFETQTSANPRRITFGINGVAAAVSRRPPNPMASLLDDADDAIEDIGEVSDDEYDSDDDARPRGICYKTFRSISAPPPRHTAAASAAAALGITSTNEARKRKCSDDTAIDLSYPRFRPLAKRAKSFSFGRSGAASASIAIPRPLTALRSAATAAGAPYSRSHSHFHRTAAAAAARSRSSSASAGDTTHPLLPSTSASSLEYFCRRSFDVSSPLRLRFRDLMINSVGRATTSYTGP